MFYCDVKHFHYNICCIALLSFNQLHCTKHQPEKSVYCESCAAAVEQTNSLSLCGAPPLSLSAHDAAVRFNALESRVLHEGSRASCGVPTDRQQHKQQQQQQGGEVTVVICQCSVIKDTRGVTMCICSPDAIFYFVLRKITLLKSFQSFSM